jgi:2'-5' RNA ligase
MENPSEDSVLLNICILPEEASGNECVALSQQLQSEHVRFVLDGVNKFAHMTVYMTRFPLESLHKVLEATEKALSNSESVACKHVGYFMTEGGYLEVSFRKTKEFLALQDLLITALKDFRLHPGKPFEEKYFAPYTSAQQKNAQETGYDLAGELYRPHITLTRYKEGEVPETFPAFVAANLSFQAKKICVFKADENGAVFELLKEFSIG